MLQPLIDLFVTWFEFFIPCFVVPEYENSVVLRFGKYHRTCEAGFHWCWPFGIEEVLDVSIVPTTMDIDPQSVTTKDQKSIVVSSVVKYKVIDPRKFLLEISDQYSAIEDITMAKTREVISQRNWEDITLKVDKDIADRVRYAVKEYGIEILPKGITLKDLQICRSIRLLQDTSPAIEVNAGD